VGASPFSEGPLITPLPGPKGPEDVSMHTDFDGPDHNSFNEGWAADTSDDDTAADGVNKNSIG
jgi:hypothetical protein